MSDSIHNISASYMMKNRSPEFTLIYEYVQNFAEKFGVIDRISQRIVKEQTGIRYTKGEQFFIGRYGLLAINTEY